MSAQVIEFPRRLSAQPLDRPKEPNYIPNDETMTRSGLPYEFISTMNCFVNLILQTKNFLESVFCWSATSQLNLTNHSVTSNTT